MRRLAFSLLGSFFVASSALAETPAPITYHFHALVEHSQINNGLMSGAPQGKPLGSEVVITVVLDPSVPGTTVNGVTTFEGGVNCSGTSGTYVYPIKSATVNGSTTQWASGGCQIVTIKNTDQGTTLTMMTGASTVGTTFYAQLTTTQQDVLTTKMPTIAEFNTTRFQSAVYQIGFNSYCFAGDFAAQ